MELNREKQVEKMAIALDDCPFLQEPIGCDKHVGSVEIAKYLCRADYRKASDVAEEIFAEIEEIRLRHIKKFEFFRNGSIEEMERKYYEGAEWGLRQLTYFLAKLKKKYTEGGE